MAATIALGSLKATTVSLRFGFVDGFGGGVLDSVTVAEFVADVALVELLVASAGLIPVLALEESLAAMALDNLVAALVPAKLLAAVASNFFGPCR